MVDAPKPGPLSGNPVTGVTGGTTTSPLRNQENAERIGETWVTTVASQQFRDAIRSQLVMHQLRSVYMRPALHRGCMPQRVPTVGTGYTRSFDIYTADPPRGHGAAVCSGTPRIDRSLYHGLTPRC